MPLIEKILNEIDRLPMPSGTAMKLLEITADPSHSIGEVIKIVESDPMLTAQVLKLVNSASFGLRGKVDSIKRAAMFVGAKTILGIAIGLSTASNFKKPMVGYESGRGQLWEHCLKTALGARMMACYTKDLVPDYLAYTAGLLHDIGKSVISEFLINTAGEFLAAIDGHVLPDYLAAEMSSLGTNHAEIGEKLAIRWGFPDSLTAAIKYHHTPSEGPEEFKAMIYCVHLGDFIAMAEGSGTGSDDFAYGFDSSYNRWVNIGMNELSFVLSDVADEFLKMKDSLFNGGDAT